MVSGYFVNVRKEQKKQLLKFIIEEKKNKDIDEILGLFSFKTGLKVTTLQIYIDEMVMAKLIKIENKYVR